MEQKKTLWIVAAAGIFLLVVVGAALILYSPSLHQSSEMKAGFDPATGWISSVRQEQTQVSDPTLAFNTEESQTSSNLPYSPFASTEEVPASESNQTETNKIAQDTASPLHADKLTVISDNATVFSTGTTTIDLNSLKASPNSGVVAKNEMTANQLNNSLASASQPEQKKTYREVEAEPLAENYYTPAPVAKAEPKESQKPQAKKAAPAKTNQSKTAAVAQAKKPAASTAATAKKVAASAKKAPDSFWVQAAAYTSKRNADEARSTLESNKIPSEVFTFTDSNGKTFYRVRVGPYVTKSEAEYWQTRIGMIDKFASAKSVIVNTAIN